MNKSWILASIIFLITLTSVYAYDTSTLLMYYGFNDGNMNNFTDSTSRLNLTAIGGTATSVTGIIGQSAQFYNTIAKYQGTINLSTSKALSINFWVNEDGTTVSPSGRYFLTWLSSLNGEIEKCSFATDTGISCRYALSPFSIRPSNNIQIPANSWNMITLVITNYTIDLYLNGVHQLLQYNYTTNLLPHSDYNKIQIGTLSITTSPNNVKIDEYSVWNTSLTNYDVNILYNSGLGLSYGDTIGSSNSTIPSGCIDANTYCTNRGFNGVGYQYYYYCNSQAESQFCSGGCINDTCYQTNSLAECGTIGESKCVDTTNYAVCSDSNNDGFLDFGELHTCGLGTYCVDGFHKAFCNNVTQNGVHDKYSLIVTPYAISDENTSYNLDATARVVTVKTVFNLHQQEFYTQGTTYISRTCNYYEHSLYSYGTQYINDSTDFDMSSATNTNSIIRLSITPNNFASGRIMIVSQSASNMGIIRYQRNSTAKSMCIYDNNNTLIYCDYDYTGGDTLQSLDLEYTYDFSSKTYTISMLFVRTFSQTKIIYPQTFIGSDIYRITLDSIVNDTTLNSIVVVNIPSFNQFTTTQNNTLLVSPCIYTSSGIYKVRTYGNMNGMPDYSVYSDYDVNVASLGLTQADISKLNRADGILSGQGLSKGTKYLIVIVTIMLEIIGFTALGFAIKMIQACFIVGSVLASFTLVIFTIFAWISWVVIIIMLIIAIAVTILISKTNTNNMEQG